MSVKIDADKIIEQYPVRQRLEVSSRVRQTLAVLTRLRDSMGFMPRELQGKIKLEEWNDDEKVAEEVSKVMDKDPLKGYFSFRHDSLRPHPMAQGVANHGILFINNQIWAVIFEDFHRVLEMPFSVFNFITMKTYGEPPVGCIVTGYNLQDEQISDSENFDNLPTKDPNPQ